MSPISAKLILQQQQNRTTTYDVGPPCASLEEFEDTKGIIRIRKSKKDIQHNGQKKNDKQKSTKHTQKTEERY